MICPSCGATAAGKFCSSCGARLDTAHCAACSVALSPGGRFCHACGAPVGAAPGGALPARGRPNLAPWIAGGAAVVALLVVLAVVVLRPAGGAPPAATPAPGGAAEVDLSAMTPRQAADRLFERVMTADERGDTTEARRFAPMAIQAYNLAQPLDEDGRYHVGLISLILGDLDGADAQADSIAQTAPDHLFAPVVRARVAARRGQDAAQRRAEQAFLDRCEAQLATNRPEYEMHGQLLRQYRDELLAARAGR